MVYFNIIKTPLLIAVYYDTKTGNVRNFIKKLLAMASNMIAININDINEGDVLLPGHLITYTTGSGSVPVTTQYFRERNFQSVLSISASGNKNWGKNFSVSGDILAERYALFLVHKFEMTGFEEDVKKVLKDIFSIEECRSRIL